MNFIRLYLSYYLARNSILYVFIILEVTYIHTYITTLGADFKNNQTNKQLNKFIWTNRKQIKFCFYLPIGLKRFVKLFSCLIVLIIRSLVNRTTTLVYIVAQYVEDN